MHVVTCDATMGERGGGVGMFEQVGVAETDFMVVRDQNFIQVNLPWRPK